MSDTQGDSQLLALLKEPGASAHDLLERVDTIARTSGTHAASRIVDLLTGLQLEEPVARRCLAEIAAHRDRLMGSLGRDPGLPLATFDYFINVDPRLRAPRMVEIQDYQEIERLAETDALTGLANRRRFREQARTELRRADRYDLRSSVLFLDLDDFKGVNDRYGHQVGDTVLIEIGKIICAAVREVDIAARYGGEEFAVLLPETPGRGAMAVAERIRSRVEERYRGGKETVNPLALTVSIGVAVFPDDARDLDSLLKRADESLYSAKSQGKNRVFRLQMERRRFVRFDMPTGVSPPSIRIGGSTVNGAETRNISRGGACIVVPAPETPTPPGTMVSIAFEEEPARPPIVVDGRIVRYHPIGKPGSPIRNSMELFEIGIAFDDLPDEPDRLFERLFALTAERTGWQATKGAGE